MKSLLLALAAFASPAAADETFEPMLPAVRLSRPDLSVRPERWDTRFALPAVEAALTDPLSLPDESAALGERMREVDSISDGLRLASELLGGATETAFTHRDESEEPDLKRDLLRLASAVASAKRELSLAMPASAGEREALLTGLSPYLSHGVSSRPSAAVFDAAAKVDVSSIVLAGLMVSEVVEQILPGLERAAAGGELKLPADVGGLRLRVGGPDDDSYSARDLADIDVLIELGGVNRYAGSAASAGAGEVRVVIDFGREVVAESSGPLATGIFGVGLLYLPNEDGPKTLTAGSGSLGVGVFGVGGLSVRGTGSRLVSRDFSLGAAAFGAGVVDSEGDQAAFSAPYMAQGFGFTRGAGLFSHRGEEGRLRCGLEYADPRDPSAAISLCLGAAYGPRAFAAGGFGLAYLEGAGMEAASSYFSQGSGYWRSWGGFWIDGDRNKLQSRRYSQGAGVHVAVGTFEMKGSSNATANWGVGPGFGWDRGVGFFDLAGDGNTSYAEWASGRGDTNGHALVSVRGRNNLLSLADFASGYLKRDAPSVALASVTGEGNRLRQPGYPKAGAAPVLLRPTPWSALRSGGLTLDPALTLPAPPWPTVARGDAERREREKLSAMLEAADDEPAASRLGQWLFLASAFGLDGTVAREAQGRLMGLSDEDASIVPTLLDPDQFLELVWQRAVAAAFGRRAGTGIFGSLETAKGLRKALLLNLLRFLPAADAAPAVTAALTDPDWRVRREAAGALGFLADRQTGQEPGRLVLLAKAAAWCGRPNLVPLSAKDVTALGQVDLTDLLSILSLDPATSQEDRVAVLVKVPNPYDPVPPEALQTFARLLAERPLGCGAVFVKERDSARLTVEKARPALVKLLGDRDHDVAAGAALALAVTGGPDQAARVAPLLSHHSGLVREAAASALGRMGQAAEPAIRRALSSTEPRVRSLGALAAAQSSEPGPFAALGRALDDPDPSVRAVALAALYGAVQAPNQPRRKQFVPRVTKMAESDRSPSVRAAAAAFLPGIR